ncbi:MAG: hypothetical protein SFV55_06470, partial [Haliscomenobacter sp.]|uniref:hypothetical protein n=1 Tax=Haliscomenobacter sp. TaxID=2717303 RepID=UPI0029AF342C
NAIKIAQHNQKTKKKYKFLVCGWWRPPSLLTNVFVKNRGRRLNLPQPTYEYFLFLVWFFAAFFLPLASFFDTTITQTSH